MKNSRSNWKMIGDKIIGLIFCFVFFCFGFKQRFHYANWNKNNQNIQNHTKLVVSKQFPYILNHMIPESTIQVPVNSSNGLGWSISHSFSVWFSIEIEVDSLTSALSIDGFALKVKKKTIWNIGMLDKITHKTFDSWVRKYILELEIAVQLRIAVVFVLSGFSFGIFFGSIPCFNLICLYRFDVPWKILSHNSQLSSFLFTGIAVFLANAFRTKEEMYLLIWFLSLIWNYFILPFSVIVSGLLHVFSSSKVIIIPWISRKCSLKLYTVVQDFSHFCVGQINRGRFFSCCIFMCNFKIFFVV